MKLDRNRLNSAEKRNDADKSKDEKVHFKPQIDPLNNFDVLFPYERIYPEQQQYLACIKSALHKKGHAIIESPPGTNHCLCLLSSLTSYQHQQQVQSSRPCGSNNKMPNAISPRIPRSRILYATNSVTETGKVAGELSVAIEFRQQQLMRKQRQLFLHENKNTRKSQKAHKVLLENIEYGFWKSTTTNNFSIDPIAYSKILNCNSSHTNQKRNHDEHENGNETLPFLALCLTGSDRDMIDGACRKNDNFDTNLFRCSITNVDNPPPNGIFFSLEQLHHDKIAGLWCCRQHLTKYAVQRANVLIVTYPYLLDPITAMTIGSALFAHNTKSSSISTKQENKKSTNKNGSKTRHEATTKEAEDRNEKTAPKCSDTIIVFDHAHNIDAACVNALSATITLNDLEQATRSLDKLLCEIAIRFKQQEQGRFYSESITTKAEKSCKNDNLKSSNSYNNIPNPLKDEYSNLVQNPIDVGVYRPTLFPPDDVVLEPVPGNIRRIKHFIGCMKKIVEHFKVRLRWAAENKQQSNIDMIGHKSKKKKMGTTGWASPLAFLHQMMNATALDSKTLRFVHFRVLSMLRTLNISRENFVGLINVAYLASLLGFTNTFDSSKFAILLEQTSVVIGHHREHPLFQTNNNSSSINAGYIVGSSNITGNGYDQGRNAEQVMMLQVACLDPSLAIKPLFDSFNTVILTSSTLSPLHFYPKILQFEPVVAESIPMTTIRPSVNPIMISRGSDQLSMSTSYNERFTMGCIRNYGKMLVDLVSTIPDGVVVYFPSYNYMEALICEWDATGIMREMTEWKLLFVETKDNLDMNTIALDNYRASCDIGRGGVFFSVARGSISEAVPFDLHYGRAAVMVGIPYEYKLSKVVQARLEYIQTHFDIREQDYLTFDAVRQVAKCFGRVIRSKTDYGVLIFADNRFHRKDKMTKLPGWISQFLSDSHQDLTTDSAVAQIKGFLRETGQPVDQKLLQDVLVCK